MIQMKRSLSVLGEDNVPGEAHEEYGKERLAVFAHMK